MSSTISAFASGTLASAASSPIYLSALRFSVASANSCRTDFTRAVHCERLLEEKKSCRPWLRS